MVVGAFKKAAEVLRGEAGRGKAQGFLKPIDTEQLAHELDLDRNARERGQNDLPPSTATSLDSNEQQIIQRLESEWSWHGASLVNELRANTGRLLSVSVHTEFARLDLLAQDALAKLRSANHRAESELGPLRENYLSARNELSEFRTKHRLNRAARTPSSRPITLGLLVLLISVEAAANAIFFAKGSDFGLLGGLWTAVCISAVNVVAAFVIGLFPLRWIRHRNPAIAFMGLITVATGLIAIVAIHGIAAHLREIPSAVAEADALTYALNSTLTSPLLLHDINSYYLFAIGIVWAAFAMGKGYNYDDPYPGYGSFFRRAQIARELYSDEHHELFDELDSIKDETVRSIDNGIVRIPLFPQQAASIRAERESLRQKFKGYEASVETAANQLLARYRDMNRLSRKATPPPKYFDDRWRLPHSFLEELSVRAASAEPPIPIMDANHALAQLKTMSETVLEEYGRLQSKYPHPTQMN